MNPNPYNKSVLSGRDQYLCSGNNDLSGHGYGHHASGHGASILSGSPGGSGYAGSGGPGSGGPGGSGTPGWVSGSLGSGGPGWASGSLGSGLAGHPYQGVGGSSLKDLATRFHAASDDHAAVVAVADVALASNPGNYDLALWCARCKEATGGDAVRAVAAEMARCGDDFGTNWASGGPGSGLAGHDLSGRVSYQGVAGQSGYGQSGPGMSTYPVPPGTPPGTSPGPGTPGGAPCQPGMGRELR